MKSASNYLGWIGRQDQSAYGGVDRYLRHTKKSEAIYAPIFLQEGLDRHNTFFAGIYESKFSANLLLFLGWFLMGGGLIGVFYSYAIKWILLSLLAVSVMLKFVVTVNRF